MDSSQKDHDRNPPPPTESYHCVTIVVDESQLRLAGGLLMMAGTSGTLKWPSTFIIPASALACLDDGGVRYQIVKRL